MRIALAEAESIRTPQTPIRMAAITTVVRQNAENRTINHSLPG